MTEADVHAAAMSGPDGRPMTAAEWQARKVPRTKTLRRTLGLIQEEFAVRWQIPIGTLRDWEQGQCGPDRAALAYLRAIAGNVVAVQRVLRAGSEAVLRQG